MSEWIKTSERVPPLNAEVYLKVMVNGEERIYIDKLIPMMNGTYIWAYGDYSNCEVVEFKEPFKKGTRVMIHHPKEYGTITGACEWKNELAYTVLADGVLDNYILHPEDFIVLESDINAESINGKN